MVTVGISYSDAYVVEHALQVEIRLGFDGFLLRFGIQYKGENIMRSVLYPTTHLLHDVP